VRYRWLIVICAVVLVVLSLASDYTKKKIYTATAQMQLLSQNVNASGSTVELTPTDIATGVQVATSSPVQQIVSTGLGRPAPPASASEVGATAVVQISVSSHDKAFAQEVANLYVNAYVAYTEQRFSAQVSSQENILLKERESLSSEISDLEQQLAGVKLGSTQALALNVQLQNASSALQTVMNNLTSLRLSLEQSPSGAVVTAPATLPHSPSSPKPITDAAVFLALGLFIGIGLAFALNYFDDRIRGRDDMALALRDVPFLAEIPKFRDWPESNPYGILAFEHPTSPEAEAYRGLRTSIEFLAQDSEGGKIIEVTSPSESDGKSTTAVNLAVTIAMGRHSVILVGGDLRRPELHKYFGIGNQNGVTTVINGTSTVEDSIVSIEQVPGLSVMTSGPIPPNPSELLGLDKTRDLFRQLAAMADFVVIDSPPVIPVTDAVVIARNVDAVIVVAKAEATRVRELRLATDLLTSVGALPSGSILNGSIEAFDRYRYRYRYRYGYRYRQAYGYGSPYVYAAHSSGQTLSGVVESDGEQGSSRTSVVDSLFNTLTKGDEE
jgi:capsular exopolysaccharide synthesis family protein